MKKKKFLLLIVILALILSLLPKGVTALDISQTETQEADVVADIREQYPDGPPWTGAPPWEEWPDSPIWGWEPDFNPFPPNEQEFSAPEGISVWLGNGALIDANFDSITSLLVSNIEDYYAYIYDNNHDIPQQFPDTSWYNETDTVFTISTADQLAGLAQLVNGGVDSFEGKTIILGNDIDLSDYGEGWNDGIGAHLLNEHEERYNITYYKRLLGTLNHRELLAYTWSFDSYDFVSPHKIRSAEELY